MVLDDLAFLFTGGQLDIWLAQQTCCAGTKCQLGLFARVGRILGPDLRGQANCQALQENDLFGAGFFEVDSQVLQEAVDYPDVELAVHGLRRPQHPTREAGETASSIQHAPMRVSGPLFRFTSWQTQLDEFCLLDGGEHARLDGRGRPGGVSPSWRTRSGGR
jgi:glycopeptidolipid biosynthesis protein